MMASYSLTNQPFRTIQQLLVFIYDGNFPLSTQAYCFTLGNNIVVPSQWYTYCWNDSGNLLTEELGKTLRKSVSWINLDIIGCIRNLQFLYDELCKKMEVNP